MTKHSTETKRQLLSLGLSVIELPAPPPLLSAEITKYKNSQGKIIRSSLLVELNFTSYTNSLLFSKTLFVPTYNQMVSPDLQKQALDTLKTLFPRVVEVPMDNSSFGGGTVHCLTREF
ncbi:MAG: agmatine deiminase family protein [Pseudobdellovibrionaceae bacterium]